MAYDGTLKFDTSISTTGFQTGINSISSIATKGIQATATILTGAATAISAIGIAAIQVGSDFESAMSKVEAIAGATADELEQLTAKAMEMGSSTVFSASESAAAFEYMALAGWKTEEMLGGIEGIMNLAAASGEDLATTTDIVTDALTAFGLSASDSGRFADILAAASSNANTNVSMMGETFKYVAPVAGALGYSAEDTAVAIGLMANAGIKASQAGTSLRTMMTRLANPSGDVKTAMEELGVTTTYADGTMKSLDEVMVELRDGFSKLSTAEQVQMASTLAGTEAMSGLLAIVNASDSDFDKLTDSIYGCDGAAAQMAETMNDNLQGQITILKSSLEGFGILLYNEMQEPLKGVVEEAQSMVTSLQDAFTNGGLDELVVEAGNVLADVVMKIADSTPQFIATATKLCTSFIDSIMANSDEFAQAGTKVIVALVNSVLELSGSLWSCGITLFAKILEGIGDNSREIGFTIGTVIAQLVKAIIDNLPTILQAGKEIITGLITGILDGMNGELPEVVAFITKLFNGLTGEMVGIIATVVAVVKVISTIGSGLTSLISVVTTGISTITAFGTKISSLVSLCTTGIAKVASFGSTIGSVLSSIVSVASSVFSTIVSTVSSVITTIGSVFTQIVSFIITTFSTVVSYVSSAISSIANFFATFGTTIAGVGAVIAGAVLAVTNFISMFQEGFDVIKSILMGVGIAIAAVGAILLGVPATVAAVVAGIIFVVANLVIVIKEHWDSIVAFFQAIPEKIGEVCNAIGTFFQNLAYEIGVVLGNIVDSVVQWVADLVSNIATMITTITSAIVTFFAALTNNVKEWLANTIAIITQWISDLITSIATMITTIISAITTFLATLVAKITEGLASALAKIREWGQNAISWVSTTIPTIISSIVSYFSTLASKIWDCLVAVVTKVTQWGENLKQKGIEAANSLVNSIVSIASTIPAKFIEIGANIVSGIWQGIQNAKTAFLSNVGSFFSGIIDSAKSVLGIHSPSKKMGDEVGEWIPPGVGEGMEDAMPELYKQAEDEMEELANRMQGVVDVETGNITVKSNATSSHKASTEIPTSGDTYVEEKFEQNNTYNVPVATPSETAKAQREAARNLLGGVK